MKRSLVLAALVVVVAALLLGPATSSASDPPNAGVLTWSAIAESAISANPTPPAPPAAPGLRPPASSTVLAAMVHGAIYDAVAAIEGGLEPFATDVPDAPGASTDAAVATAAWWVLTKRVPGQTGVVGPLYTSYIGDIAPSTAKDDGIAVGLAAAKGMLALRDGDGFDLSPTYQQPTPGPGVFQKVPPGTSNPVVDQKLANVRPFTFANPSDYRPAAPYPLTSKRYAQDIAEIQEAGKASAHVPRTARTDTVDFFASPTFVQYSRGMRALIGSRGLSLRESARLLGYTWCPSPTR